jgi:putative PIN family toxin of toxin-antitoxin system
VRIVLGTNVFVSGVFFGGVPGRILDAWRDARVRVALSANILEEYQRVGQVLGAQYPGVDLEPFLGLLTVEAEIVEAPELAEPVCSDPDDDKCLACAIAAEIAVIVSGDRDLVDQSEWRGLRVLRPRQFADEFLSGVADAPRFPASPRADPVRELRPQFDRAE